MAELSTAQRKKLSRTQFGLPDRRGYPMPDASHAINAKARAKQMLAKGKLSQADYEHIITMANHKIAQFNSNG